jgi:hypothetical protein
MMKHVFIRNTSLIRRAPRNGVHGLQFVKAVARRINIKFAPSMVRSSEAPA